MNQYLSVMKSFQKFILMAALPLAAIAVVSIIISGSLENLGNLAINLRIGGFFIIIAFGYAFVFERLRQRSVEYPTPISALFVFVTAFLFAVIFDIINNTVRTTNENIPLLQATLVLCIFLFYVFSFRIYSISGGTKITFSEKPLFYIKLLLLSSSVTAILFLIFVSFDSTLATFNLNQIIDEILLVVIFSFLMNNSSLLSIFIGSKISLITINIVIGITAATVLSFCLNMLLLATWFSRIHVYSVHTFFFTLLITTALYTILLHKAKERAMKGQFNVLTVAASQKDAEYQLLKSQINPHFLFNNLNTLISFIETEPKKAVSFGHHLSNVYRHYLKNNSEDFVALDIEMQFISEYLEIYKAKFSSGFSFKINTPNAANYFILSAALQEIIENIFKHNELDEADPLQINITLEENSLVIENTLHPKTLNFITKLGLENISKRYHLLTGRNIIIEKSAAKFLVKLPLFNSESE